MQYMGRINRTKQCSMLLMLLAAAENNLFAACMGFMRQGFGSAGGLQGWLL